MRTQEQNKWIEKGELAEIKKFLKHLNYLKRWIKDILWCNAHDKGLLEDIIRKIKKIEKELKEKN